MASRRRAKPAGSLQDGKREVAERLRQAPRSGLGLSLRRNRVQGPPIEELLLGTSGTSGSTRKSKKKKKKGDKKTQKRASGSAAARTTDDLQLSPLSSSGAMGTDPNHPDFPAARLADMYQGMLSLSGAAGTGGGNGGNGGNGGPGGGWQGYGGGDGGWKRYGGSNERGGPVGLFGRPPSRDRDGMGGVVMDGTSAWGDAALTTLDGRPPSRGGGIRPNTVTGWLPSSPSVSDGDDGSRRSTVPFGSSDDGSPSAAGQLPVPRPYVPASGPLVRTVLVFDGVSFDGVFGSPPSDTRVEEFLEDFREACETHAGIDCRDLGKLIVGPGVRLEVRAPRSVLLKIADAARARKLTAFNGATARLEQPQAPFFLGDEVLAPWADDGYLYPATVLGLNGDQAQLEFEDDSKVCILPVADLHLRHPDPAPVIRPGNYVLTIGDLRLRHEPAVVLGVRVVDSSEARFTVGSVNRQDNFCRTRNELVRISEEQFKVISERISQACETAAATQRLNAIRQAGARKVTGAPAHQRTVAIMLPTAVAQGLASPLLSAAIEAGLDVVIDRPLWLTRQRAEELFAVHRNEQFFKGLVQEAVRAPCHVALLDGPGAIESWYSIAAEVQTALPPKALGKQLPILYGSQDEKSSLHDAALIFNPQDVQTIDPRALPGNLAHLGNREVDSACTSLIGQPVLARWHLDGWFFRLTVVGYLGGGVLLTEDSDGTRDTVGYGSVLATRSLFRVKQEGDAVLCTHPRHMDSYAPGQVQVTFDGVLVVVFYDNVSVLLDASVDCYCLRNQSLYDNLVRFINRCEAGWIGKQVLVRTEQDGFFHMGVVLNWMAGGQPHCYQVELNNGTTMDALDVHVHLFAENEKPVIQAGDHVVGPYLESDAGCNVVFAPGQVVGHDDLQLMVEFWDGRRSLLDPTECVWISEEYFELCVLKK
eukprot:m.446854 g.446854  ORF g.446854 m.446854 type:complete len:931 (-) comp20313_c0_seq6:623-3415(-)